MSDNKTQATGQSVSDFIATVAHPTRRADAERLNAFFQHVTGWSPRMWGPSIIGFGRYRYTYESGRSGSFLATGFSPRKASLSVYIMPGYTDFAHILERLGKYKIGKSCLYINKLADIDMVVLEELIKEGLADLSQKWPVEAS